MQSEKITKTDKPAKYDFLEIDHYISGLSEFIISCETPMTIAIQGEWGSGKSSIMQQVNNKIMSEENVVTVWFDTWQFSQFSNEDNLAVIMLDRLLDGIENNPLVNKEKTEKDSNFDKVKETVSSIAKGIGNLSSLVLARLISKSTQGLIKEEDLTDNIKISKENDKQSNVYQAISDLRNDFQKYVNEKDKIKRVVIFIDDLDRLMPERAVELLEVLKVFLDVEKCVFVLAIDYDVVARGSANKYGFRLENKEDMEKAKSYFDKIIQVPFNVPTFDYRFENYIKNLLEKHTENTIELEVVKKYSKLVTNSIGYNPRSIKRALNAFDLIKLTRQDKDKNQENDSLMLFSQICMQNAYPELFRYISANTDKLLTNILGNYKKDLKEEGILTVMLENFIEEIDTQFKDSSDQFLGLLTSSSITYASSKEISIATKEYNNLDDMLDNWRNHKGFQYSEEKIRKLVEYINSINNQISNSYRFRSNQWVIAFNYKSASILEIYLNKQSPTYEFKFRGISEEDDLLKRYLEKYDKKGLTAGKALAINYEKYNLSSDEGQSDIKTMIEMIISHR